MFDDPQWMQLQERGGLASAPRLLRVLAGHVRTLQKAVRAVARQDGPDVLGMSGVVSVGGYLAEGLRLHGTDLLLQPGRGHRRRAGRLPGQI